MNRVILGEYLKYFWPTDVRNNYELATLFLMRISFAGYTVCYIWFEQIYIMNYNIFFLTGIASLITIVIELIMTEEAPSEKEFQQKKHRKTSDY